jgi:hypothetical protein
MVLIPAAVGGGEYPKILFCCLRGKFRDGPYPRCSGRGALFGLLFPVRGVAACHGGTPFFIAGRGRLLYLEWGCAVGGISFYQLARSRG